ncbi:MAG: hypothetical protein MZW92_40030 [Comamonadaceae bacterium]|nr:hypothetical protein [Comamonadaceae bacterium]
MIGFGGGAALDVAKVVGADGGARRRRARVRRGTTRRCGRSPTSCRTSSRCRPPPAPAPRSAARAVVSEDDTHVKRIVFSPKLLAQGGVRRPGADARPAGRRSPPPPAWTR